MHSATADVRQAGLWTSLRQALTGTHFDYTELTLNRAIILLAVPMVLEMSMESLFGVADMFWVARLGEDAIATVGLTEGVVTIVFALALGVSMAATALVARRIGEKDEEGARTAAVQTLILSLFVSGITAVLGSLYAPNLLRLTGGSENVVRIGSTYTRIYLGGVGSVYFLFVINAVLRGAGDTSTAMRALWLANLINIALNPCLIYGLGPFPKFGLAGSAIGTTVGRSAGALLGLWMLTRGSGKLRVPLRAFRLHVKTLLHLARLSVGGAFQYFIQMAAWVAMVRVIAGFGSAAVAANTLALRIVIFGILPSWGVANAAATLVGQNLGAHKPERAEQAVWRTGLYNAIMLALLGIVFFVLSPQVIHIFTSDPAVAELAIKGLRLLSLGYVSYGYGMVMVQAINGAGDTVTPTVLNFIAFWLFQLPLGYWLTRHTTLGLTGAWIAVLGGDTLLALAGVLWFRTGRWKQVTV